MQLAVHANREQGRRSALRRTVHKPQEGHSGTDPSSFRQVVHGSQMTASASQNPAGEQSAYRPGVGGWNRYSPPTFSFQIPLFPVRIS